MHPAIDYWSHILPYVSHLFALLYVSEILRNVNPICQLPSGISFHCKEQRPNYPCRLATLRCLNGRRLSVHHGNHNGVVGIFVGLPESCSADDCQSEHWSNGGLAWEVHLNDANGFAAVFLWETQGPSTSSGSTVTIISHVKTQTTYCMNIRILISFLLVWID